MNTSDKIQALLNECGKDVEIGKKFGLISKGWLRIIDEEGSWNVMRTSRRGALRPLIGSSIGVDFDKSTGGHKADICGLLVAWKIKVDHKVVTDEKEVKQIIRDLERFIDEAHANKAVRRRKPRLTKKRA